MFSHKKKNHIKYLTTVLSVTFLSGCIAEDDVCFFGYTSPPFEITVYDSESGEVLCERDEDAARDIWSETDWYLGECEFTYKDNLLLDSTDIITSLNGYDVHTEQNVVYPKNRCSVNEGEETVVDIHLIPSTSN